MGIYLNMANLHMTQRSHPQTESCIICAGCPQSRKKDCSVTLNEAMDNMQELVAEGLMTPDGRLQGDESDGLREEVRPAARPSSRKRGAKVFSDV